jgi:hypothetical protein
MHVAMDFQESAKLDVFGFLGFGELGEVDEGDHVEIIGSAGISSDKTSNAAGSVWVAMEEIKGTGPFISLPPASMVVHGHAMYAQGPAK